MCSRLAVMIASALLSGSLVGCAGTSHPAELVEESRDGVSTAAVEQQLEGLSEPSPVSDARTTRFAARSTALQSRAARAVFLSSISMAAPEARTDFRRSKFLIRLRRIRFHTIKFGF